MALVRKPKSITMSDISLLPNLYVILFTTEHLNFYSPWNNHFSASVYSFHGKQILAEIGFQMSCCVIWEQTWFFWWSSYIYRYLLTKLSRCITIQLFTKLQPYCIVRFFCHNCINGWRWLHCNTAWADPNLDTKMLNSPSLLQLGEHLPQCSNIK